MRYNGKFKNPSTLKTKFCNREYRKFPQICHWVQNWQLMNSSRGLERIQNYCLNLFQHTNPPCVWLKPCTGSVINIVLFQQLPQILPPMWLRGIKTLQPSVLSGDSLRLEILYLPSTLNEQKTATISVHLKYYTLSSVLYIVCVQYI